MADDQITQDKELAPEEQTETTETAEAPEATETEAPLEASEPSSEPETSTDDASTSSEAPAVETTGVFEAPEYAEVGSEIAEAADGEAPAEAENPTTALGTEGQAELPSDGTSTSTDAPAPESSSTSPASEEAAPLGDDASGSTGPGAGDAGTAPSDEVHEEQAPLDVAQSDASLATEETSGEDAASADESGEGQTVTDKKPEGDVGVGPTHCGTDTPPILKSNPCDPVTGKPLSEVGQGGNATGLPQIGGGHLPAISPTGAVSQAVAQEYGFGTDEESEGEEGQDLEYVADTGAADDEDDHVCRADLKEALGEAQALAELLLEKLAELNDL